MWWFFDSPLNPGRPLFCFSSHPLPLSLSLIPAHQTRNRADERCNPMEQRCQTPMHVWEASCAACGGLGASRPRARFAGGGRGRGRGRGTPHAAYTTCAVCTGVGYVRHTSSRVWPDLRGGGASASSSSSTAALTSATLGRPPRGPGDESDSESEWESDDEEEEGDSNSSGGGAG